MRSSNSTTVVSQPKREINARKFNADRAGAHHDQRLRHVVQFEDVVGIDDLLAVGFKSGNRPHDRAGGDDDVLGLDSFFFAVGQRDLDLAWARRSCAKPLKTVTLFFFIR